LGVLALLFIVPVLFITFQHIHEKFKNEEALSIRGIKKSGVINIKEFYNLFPGGPLKKSTMIAGIPKPKSCI
jgi:tRNA 2-thiouridine synthesizing protein E